MNKIKFPLLNLNLNISNIAISIFGIDIYWYAILIVMAMIIGLIILKFRQRKFKIKFPDFMDLCIYLIPITIICARLYYVLFNLDYYLQKPKQIFNIRTGGLAIYGGIIGGIITCYIFCKKRKIDFVELLDYAIPCLALRSIDWKMGKFCKYRSIWGGNYITLENGHI